MKITYATYPFQGLPGGDTQKPAAVPVKQDLTDFTDVFVSSSEVPAAALRYIQTIEQVTSEIMNMTGDDLEVQAGEATTEAPAGAPLEPLVTRDDTLIFLPAAHRSAGPGETPDQLVIIKNMVQPGAAGVPEGSEEDIATALAKDVARKLPRTDYRPGSGSVNPDSPRVMDKFIISVNMVDDIPVPVVIRHDPSGGAALLNKGGESAGNIVVPDEVTKIAVFLAGLGEEEASREDLPVASERTRPGKTGDGKGDVGSGVVEKSGRPVWTSLLTNPSAAVEGIRQAASRFFSGAEDREAVGGGPNEKNVQDPAAGGLEGLTNPVTVGGEIPGVVVKFIEGVATVGPSADNSASDAKIVEKVISLSGAVNGLVKIIVSDVEERADDDGAPAGARSAPVKEAVRQAVKASFQAALNRTTDYGADEAGKTLGMTLDEGGLLKLDRAALVDSLSTNKSETVRFVHDLAVSLHDRITYNVCAFAGLYVGAGETVVGAPRGKEGAAGEDADRKADFEKRLNELQMLLKSSYELKESFMQRKFAGQDGQDEETQREGHYPF